MKLTRDTPKPQQGKVSAAPDSPTSPPVQQQNQHGLTEKTASALQQKLDAHKKAQESLDEAQEKLDDAKEIEQQWKSVAEGENATQSDKANYAKAQQQTRNAQEALQRAQAAVENTPPLTEQQASRLQSWNAQQANEQIREQNEKLKEIVQSAAKSIADLKTGVHGANNQFYNQIIYESFNPVAKNLRAENGMDKKMEICSILDQYSWHMDGFNKASFNTVNGVHTSAPVPHCYLIEYQQKHSSNITNFVNTLAATGSALFDPNTSKSFDLIGNKLGKLYGALQSALLSSNDAPQNQPQQPAQGGVEAPKSQEKSFAQDMKETAAINYAAMLSKVSSGFGALWSNIQGGANAIQNAIMNSDYLSPYKLLYSLEPTQQRYVFPMIAQPPINKVINTYGEKQEGDSRLSQNSIISWVNGIATGVTNFVRDMNDLASLIGGGSETYKLSHVEKAKFFNYPQQTEEYTITFPLLNTVKSQGSVPNWKKNYKFLFLFSLKNMVFRRDNASFFPPLLYDLIIPGVVRQPFCYIKEMSVKPVGLVRMMNYTNMLSFLGQNGTSYAVAVPQAWIVTIKVKSLLATTSNMVMSSLKDLSINSQTVSQLGQS